MNLSLENKNFALAVFSEIHREVQALRGLFRMQIGSRTLELPVEHWGWHPVPGVPGTEICPIPPEHWPTPHPANTDYFASRGTQGSRPDAPVRLTQAARMEVQRGVIDYKKESWGGYVEHHAGDVFEVEPGEAYTFLAKTDFLNLVSFCPRVTLP